MFDSYKLQVGQNSIKMLLWMLFLSLNFLVSAQTKDTAFVITPEVEAPVISPEKVHSPHKATIYSAVFPGLGQIYNKKYWKLPFLYGGIGGVSYAIHFNTKYYKIYRSAYRDFRIRDPGNNSYIGLIPPGLTVEQVHGQYSQWFIRALENKKKYYKRYRDLSYIGMAAIYVVNIIDASIDAHFFNFDISDDLSFWVEPAYLQPQPQSNGTLGLQLKFQF